MLQKMNKKQAQKIFEKYNPTSGVIRCPNGRASVRKLLDTYARSAVNLYGIISMAELVEIFNRQNVEQTTSNELFALLLPLIYDSFMSSMPVTFAEGAKKAFREMYENAQKNGIVTQF